MRRFLAAVVAVVVLLAGYLTLDIFDIVPGFLTRSAPSPIVTAPAPRASVGRAVAVPTVDAGAQPLAPASAGAPIPVASALRARLGGALTDPALGPHPGFVVRDAFTGQQLLAVDADRPRVAASTGKLLTALAVVTTLDPHATMPTTVVQGGSPGEIVLVAGGDTMLAPGAGNLSPSAGYRGR